MVRSAETRSVKYDKKIDGAVINQRITAQKKFMVEQVRIMAPLQTYYERKIKKYLEAIGMYGIEQHHYMNFGGGLWARSRSFKGVTLQMEAEAWASRWLRRGLSATHLIAIAAMFGIDLTTWG